MYAIIQTGGKQYQVKEGDLLQVEKIPGVEGQEVTFKRVLFYRNGDDAQIGTPLLTAASVAAEIIKNGQGKKIIVFKKKRRKGFAKKQGHRQEFTEVKITKINI